MTAETEAGTASAPDPLLSAGRLEREAARAWTERLFIEHGRMVAGVCRGLLRDGIEAEDAAQQSFLSAYRAILRGAEPHEPAAWVAAIARNECLGRIRERMRRPLPVDDAAETAVSGSDPLDEAIRRADMSALWAAISTLAPQQREALLLREFGGLSYDELGVALGVSVPAVESLLFRARTRLRGELQEAFAAASSAGWLSALRELAPRFLGMGGAAKVAAATVGAGVLAGGAVVSEHEFVRHPPQPAASAAAAATSRSAPQAAPPAVVFAPAATRVSEQLRRRRAKRVGVFAPGSRLHERSRDGGGDSADSGMPEDITGGSNDAEGAPNRDGGGQAAADDGRSSAGVSGGEPGDGRPAAETDSNGASQHSGASEDGGASQDTGGDGPAGDGSGSDPTTTSSDSSGSSSDSSGDGGLTVTTVTTVPVPVSR